MPVYPGISRDAFRHPLDQQAEATLRSVPGFDVVARKFVEFIYERPQYVSLMGNTIQVGPQQYSTPLPDVSGLCAVPRCAPGAHPVCGPKPSGQRLFLGGRASLCGGQHRPAGPPQR
jgi:hypothetical protein